jgi:hypothetical protein
VKLLFIGGALTAATCTAGVQPAETKANGCDAMVGVWEYLEPSAPGHAIIAKQGSKYLGVFINTLPAPDAPRTRPSADAKKGSAHPTSVAGAWEYTCEASAGKARLKLRWLYSSFGPQDVGSEATIDVELDGSQAKWWWIEADGKRGTMGAGRLLK